jgi:hypothetical protein
MYEQLSKPIHEINNGSLQLFIFSLLSNKLLSIRYLLVTSFLARKEGSNPKGTFSKGTMSIIMLPFGLLDKSQLDSCEVLY